MDIVQSDEVFGMVLPTYEHQFLAFITNLLAQFILHNKEIRDL
jgi:hypothetical protein